MAATAPTHESLDVWRVAMELVVEIYRLSRKLPTEERYGLVSQIRRAAISVALNIAEGSGRHARGDFLHFLSIARGSLRELECIVAIVERLGLSRSSDLETARALADRVGRMLNRLRRSLLPRSPSKHAQRSTKHVPG
jgi:four helix bundle protein